MTATIHQPIGQSLRVRPQPWPCDCLVLAATHTALTCTSLMMQHTLSTWRLRRVSSQVEAVALQLVANAIEATGTTNDIEHLGIIVVGLRQAETDVVVEVWDSDPEPPTGPAPAGYPSGYFALETGGKVVWTAVRYLLPQRTPSAFAYTPPRDVADGHPSMYTNDPRTMQRVQDGLRAVRVAIPTAAPKCHTARPLPAQKTPHSRIGEVGLTLDEAGR